ncbi:hypothetical protein ES703_58444 [subsurface metagenome]
MVISTYRVNNVLRVYGDQLRQSRLSSKEKSGDIRSPDKINISSEAKRKAIIDKIASDIVDRITRYGPRENVEKDVFKQLEDEYGAHLAISRNTPTDLIFKVIDGSGETINALSIEDSQFLRYKLKEITRDIVDKNMM